MSDKRSACRVRRRLPVVFSDGKQPHRGQTANLSRTGACIHSDYVVAPGVELQLTLGLPGVAEVRVRALVEWARKLRGTETLQAGHSMGLRYLSSPGPEYAQFMAVIEGLAQPHGLATRQAATDDAPAAPHREPHPAAPSAPIIAPPGEPHPVAPTAPPPRPTPRRAHATGARHEPEPRAYPTPRRAHAIDPRQEPETGSRRRPQREIVEIPPLIVESEHRRPELSVPRPRLEKNLDFVVDANDLAAPSGYPCSLSTARVAWLLEQGAAEAIAPSLRGGMASVGVNLEVSVPQRPVAIGTALSTVVKLAELSPDRRTLVFEIEITDRDRLVASGRHVRTLMEPPAA